MLTIQFNQKTQSLKGALVFLSFEDHVLSQAALAYDHLHQGILVRALENNRFKGKRNETLILNAPLSTSYTRIILLGVGQKNTAMLETWQEAGGHLVAALRSTPDVNVEIELGTEIIPSQSLSEVASHIAFGAQLRQWRFDKYRTKEEPHKKRALQQISIILSESDQALELYTSLEQVAYGVNLTRELITEPPNILYPESYAKRLKEFENIGIEVEILKKKDLEKLGMGALIGVAQGSIHDPRVVILQWKGGPKDQKPMAFVGKGVTFDTGGICIKPSAGMADMKYDMGGSAVVAGLIRALAGRKAPVNAIGVLGIVENMPSGTAQRPSDVVTSLSGQTIEVLDTDAEGRLVLADVLWYTQDRFKPRLMVDLATLTGAIGITFGSHYAGLFSNDDDLCEQLTAAGEKVGECIWRLPLGAKYDQEINSDIADVKNLGIRGKAGSIAAAQFLLRFVNNVPWAHLDIASVTWSEKDLPLMEKGATAFGVRLLNQFVKDYYES